MKKRLLSILLAFSMVLTFLPLNAVTAFADGTLLDDLEFVDGAPVNKNTPSETEGTGWKKVFVSDKSTYPFLPSDMLALTGGPEDTYNISGIDYPVLVMNDAQAPDTAASIDGSSSHKVVVVGGNIQGGQYSDRVELWLGSKVYDGTFEEPVYFESRQYYSTTHPSDYVYNQNPNKIYGGKFKKGLVPQSYGSTGYNTGDAYAYHLNIYGGTFCKSPGNEDHFVGWGAGASYHVYGGVFEKLDPNSDFGYIEADTHYTLTTREDCTINDIITSGSAVIVPNEDTASKDTYPTKVTLHYTGNDAVLYWNVEYQPVASETYIETVALTGWTSGAEAITGANTDTVTFTAKPNSTDVRVYPVLAAKKNVTLNSSVSGITAKAGSTDLTITDNKFEAADGQTVTITAPALTDANMKYQWTIGGNTATEGVSDDGTSYTFTISDNVTIGLEIVDKIPEIPAGDTKSTTLTNAVLKKVVNDGTDITNSITKNADGSYNIPIGAEVTVAFDKDAFADSGSKFSYWKITGLTQDEANRYNKQESFTFTMPDKAVTLEAMTQDESIDDTTAEILGTAAIIGTAVVGTAVLAYQGHQLGTQLYLTYLLPSGAVIPANRIQLAMLLWQDAGDPAPVDDTAYSDLDADDSDTLQAAQWAVETGLMELPDPDNAPDQFDPYTAVSTVEVIHAWKNAQKMKG